MNNNSADNRTEELANILKRIQSHVRTSYPRALTKESINERDVKSYIEKFIRDHEVIMDGFTGKQLITRVYWEMVEYSVITPYLVNKEVEEININSWDAIRIHWRGGKIELLKDCFLSPMHARDVILRLLQAESEILLDENTPVVRGHLKNNIRISASSTPVLDPNRGVQASIRMINPGKMKRRDFIKYGTLTADMFSFLAICFSHGESMCLTGATDSGKTTLMSGVLGEVPKDHRIITIEDETREFDLVHRNIDGVIDNNVIHWVTHNGCSMERLLVQALTTNPKHICMAETKDEEAYAVQEAARTGHSVITTTHADSCRDTYDRFVTLCLLKRDIEYNTIYRLVAKAFPIVIFTKLLNDHSRKVMEITECVQNDDRTVTINTLYEYVVEENDTDADGNTVISGEFVKRNNISQALQHRLLNNGVSKDAIQSMLRGEVA